MEITEELVQYIVDELWRTLGLAEGAPAQAAPARAMPAQADGRRRVLAEGEVKALCPAAGGPGQVLRLAPGDILTPLAMDYILSFKITVERG